MLIVVVCRTVYLHCQICWNLHITRVPLIILNVVGWLIPAVLLGVVFGVAQITYTISNHCSIRVDWVVNLLIIPIIIEIGCAIVVQLATFVYCVNVYLRSLSEPPPPTDDSLGMTTTTSTYSTGSGRYPYRKAIARVNKVTSFSSLLIVGGQITMACLGSMLFISLYWHNILCGVLCFGDKICSCAE
jgi:hypothetical protein